MKEKTENILYFLTIWFCVSVIVLFAISIIMNLVDKKCTKQEKQIYIIQSPMYFDSLGNMTITRKVIDHIPTHQDSIEIGFIFN